MEDKIICPRCGFRQPSTENCRKCGINIPRYLELQRSRWIIPEKKKKAMIFPKKKNQLMKNALKKIIEVTLNPYRPLRKHLLTVYHQSGTCLTGRGRFSKKGYLF